MTIRRYLVAPPQGSGGGEGGAVDSVNGQTGAVVLDAADVGADPAGTAEDAIGALNTVTVVENGATTGTARPPVPRVLWLGSVRPANMIAGDIYFEVSATPVAFSPLDLDNLWLWFDAEELALSNGATVSTWLDLSGAARNLTATGTPTYAADGLGTGHPSVNFPGSARFDTAAFTALSTALTMFVVAQVDDLTSTQTITDGEDPTATGRLALFRTGSTDAWGISRNTSLNAAGSSAASTAPALFRVAYGVAGASSLYVDGVQVIAPGNAGSASPTKLRLGANFSGANFLTGDIGEVLLYARTLGAGEITQVEDYLTAKWGL